MFDKRLMAMCPKSKKYFVGNIICQWTELIMNAVMIFIISTAVEKLYRRKMTANGVLISLGILAGVLVIRFFMTKKLAQMSYLASKTVKRVIGHIICGITDCMLAYMENAYSIHFPHF